MDTNNKEDYKDDIRNHKRFLKSLNHSQPVRGDLGEQKGIGDSNSINQSAQILAAQTQGVADGQGLGSVKSEVGGEWSTLPDKERLLKELNTFVYNCKCTPYLAPFKYCDKCKVKIIETVDKVGLGIFMQDYKIEDLRRSIPKIKSESHIEGYKKGKKEFADWLETTLKNIRYCEDWNQIVENKIKELRGQLLASLTLYNSQYERKTGRCYKGSYFHLNRAGYIPDEVCE